MNRSPIPFFPDGLMYSRHKSWCPALPLINWVTFSKLFNHEDSVLSHFQSWSNIATFLIELSQQLSVIMHVPKMLITLPGIEQALSSNCSCCYYYYHTCWYIYFSIYKHSRALWLKAWAIEPARQGLKPTTYWLCELGEISYSVCTSVYLTCKVVMKIKWVITYKVLWKVSVKQ